MNLKKCFLTTFLIYFLSIGFIYSEPTTKNDSNYLIPIGNITQIDAELQYLMVRNNFTDSSFKIGDSLVSINNNEIKNYSDFSSLLNPLSENENIKVQVLRNNEKIDIDTNKEILEKINFNNIVSGFATLTYVNPHNNNFGAVAHPISVGFNKNLPIKNGYISSTSNLTIDKSYKGTVGCINGEKNEFIGDFKDNSSFGIKGTIHKLDLSKFKQYKIAQLGEVKTGKASILLQTSNGEPREYEINILNIKKQRNPESKTFKIEIIDKELLQLTGGIVQGMSGTPIVQDDKIIGAVSHAIENNPATGYGVYIGWMLEGE